VVAIAQLVEHRIVIPAVAGSSPVSHPTFFMVAIAQLVEHRIVIPAVAGSSPVSHPIKTLFPMCIYEKTCSDNK
jgi:hypothetical protein